MILEHRHPKFGVISTLYFPEEMSCRNLLLHGCKEPSNQVTVPDQHHRVSRVVCIQPRDWMIPVHNESPRVALNCHKYYLPNTKYRWYDLQELLEKLTSTSTYPECNKSRILVSRGKTICTGCDPPAYRARWRIPINTDRSFEFFIKFTILASEAFLQDTKISRIKKVTSNEIKSGDLYFINATLSLLSYWDIAC